MKKIIAIVTLFFAFSIGANAQEKKVSSADTAKKEVAALTAKIKIAPALQADLTTLLTDKHNALSNPAITEMEKANLAKHTERKIMSALTEEQRNVLINNPELLKQLTH